MSRGLGELAVAAAWWLVVLGADYVQRGHFAATPALLAHAVAPLAVLAGWAPTGALAGLLSLPLSLAAGGHLWRHHRQAARLRLAIGLTIAAANLHALALAAGLGLHALR